MSEPIWCNIHLVVPASWGEFPAIVEDLADDVLNSEVDMIETADRRVFHLAGEGNYGLADSRIEERLDQLRKLSVPFTASSDTKYEYIGTMIVFDGNDEIDGTWTEEPMLGQSDYALIEQSAHPWARTVGEYFDRLGVDAGDFDIAHLPTCEPELSEA